MPVYFSSDKLIFIYLKKPKFISISKQWNLSLFGFVILYWLNIKKIELVLSETKVLVTLKFQRGH